MSAEEASPRPWHVMQYTAEDEPDRIIDANGDEVAIELLEADAQLIVDAVNERDDLVENLKTAHANRERENAIWEMVVMKLKAERDRAVKYAEAAPHPGSAPWKEMQAVYAERDRLRDLVGRLAQRIQFARLADPNPGGEDPLPREAAAVCKKGREET